MLTLHDNDVIVDNDVIAYSAPSTDRPASPAVGWPSNLSRERKEMLWTRRIGTSI